MDVRVFLPELALPSGRCKNLQEDMSCGVYETRPELCRIDKTVPEGMRVCDWFALNVMACGVLQERLEMLPRKPAPGLEPGS